MLKSISFIAAAAIIVGCSSTKTGTMNSATSNTLTEKEKRDGWQLLFDGTSMNNFHTYGSQTVALPWEAADGAIHLSLADRSKWPSGSKDIVTNEEYDNFHFSTEWKIAKNGNSGIIFYVNEDKSKYKNTYETGPEMQVLDNDGHPDAKINKHRAGDLYDLIASSPEVVKPAGEWNKAEIISNKGKLDFYLNGQKVVSTTMWDASWKQMVAGSKFKTMPGFGIFKKGKIALQEHGDEVWYRNIKIRKL
jgi:hypothetical protein